jgi:hypothetical protein
MRAPSVGLARSAFEIRLFIWRTTAEGPNTYGCENPANPTDETFWTAPTSPTRSAATATRCLTQVMRGPGEARQALGQEPSISIRAERD